MPEFSTFDLGRVIQTAEAIKNLRRQGTMDKLQEQYIQQVQHGAPTEIRRGCAGQGEGANGRG
jgi:hypothetical protein